VTEELPMWSTFVYQFWSLLTFALWNAVTLPCSLLKDVALLLFLRAGRERRNEEEEKEEGDRVTFYEGVVEHVRTKPVENAFKYKVRLCLVNLDNPPQWWLDSTTTNQSDISLTSNQVRERCKTGGPVRILTVPSCCGYTQNPISVYYAYDEDCVTLKHCIAEVTNTPWGERVLFTFDPGMKEGLPKSLHVSPFMDLKNTWKIKTEAPSENKGLRVHIQVGHPEHGNYFMARLSLKESKHRTRRSESADFSTLYNYGYMPQRVAVWIYWQAMVLLWKGAPLFMHPTLDSYRGAVAKEMNQRQKESKFCSWDWKHVRWPWNRE